MKYLTLSIFLIGVFGTLAIQSKEAHDNDPSLIPSPSVDHPHHVQRRVMEEDNPFIGDPVVRFFLNVLLSPYSFFTPERKTLHHASKLPTGLTGNLTNQKTQKSKNIKKLNESEKFDTSFGKMESKSKRSEEFRAARRQHVRLDAFPIIFHRPMAARSGPVVDMEMHETADGISTERPSEKPGMLEPAGSMAHVKNTTNNFLRRACAFIWSIDWRFLGMHIMVVLVIAMIITLSLVFCQTVSNMNVKKVKLHPDKSGLAKDEKFVTKEQANNMC